jgi:ferritin
MITDQLADALNGQVEKELHAAHLYLAMSSWFETQGLAGCASWMRVQYHEEVGHALRIFDFVNEAGGRAVVPAVAAPQAEWSTPLNAFESAYEHERRVTGMINDLAGQEKDHAAGVMLQWFVSEQVEEEASVSLIVNRLKLIGDDRAALLVLDEQLGSRHNGAPPAASA